MISLTNSKISPILLTSQIVWQRKAQHKMKIFVWLVQKFVKIGNSESISIMKGNNNALSENIWSHCVFYCLDKFNVVQPQFNKKRNKSSRLLLASASESNKGGLISDGILTLVPSFTRKAKSLSSIFSL